MDLDSSILQQLDFGNTIDHSARTKIVNIVVISTTVTIVSIRTIIRLAIIRRLGIDDSMYCTVVDRRAYILTILPSHNTLCGSISDRLLYRSSLW